MGERDAWGGTGGLEGAHVTDLRDPLFVRRSRFTPSTALKDLVGGRLKPPFKVTLSCLECANCLVSCRFTFPAATRIDLLVAVSLC